MKQIAYIICTFLSLHSVMGQNNISFSKFGLPDWSEIPILFVQGNNGDIIICGGRNSNTNNDGNSFILQLDSTGKIAQYLQIVDTSFTRCFLSAGEYQNGYFFILRSCPPTPPFNVIFSLITTDASLNLINDIIIPYNDTMRQNAGCAIMDSRGDYVFCAELEKSGGSILPYLVKIDSLGNIKEQQFDVFPGYQFGSNAKIIEDHTSNGYFLGSQNKNGGGGERILHLDNNFNILSDTIRYPHYMYRVRDLKKQNPDRILVTSNITTTNGNLVLAAFDTTGRMLHFLERSKPGYWLDGGNDPLAVTDSSIFFATFHCIPGDMVFPPIHNNIFVQKLDTAFQVLWEAELGWDAYFRHSNIMATPDGGCLVLASVYDSDTMYLQHDVVLFKLDGNGKLIGVTNLTPKPEALTISPNPGQHQFELHGANSLQRIEVFDTGGRLVKTKILNGEQTIISMEEEPAGLYLIKATDASGRTFPTLKWVKGE